MKKVYWETSPGLCSAPIKDARGNIMPTYGKIRTIGWNGKDGPCHDNEILKCEGKCGHSVQTCIVKECAPEFMDDGLFCTAYVWEKCFP
jgi:hypothetical protein